VADPHRGQRRYQDHRRLPPPSLRHRLHQEEAQSDQEDHIRCIVTDQADPQEDDGHRHSRGQLMHIGSAYPEAYPRGHWSRDREDHPAHLPSPECM
jgi:hypothetical protein